MYTTKCTIVANGTQWPKVDIYFNGQLIGFARDEMGDLYVHALPESVNHSPEDLIKVAIVIREALSAGNVEQARSYEEKGDCNGILPWNISNVKSDRLVERVKGCVGGYAYL